MSNFNKKLWNLNNIQTSLISLVIFFIILNTHSFVHLDINTSVSFNNLWWHSYMLSVVVMLAMPQIAVPALYCLNFYKFFFIKLFIKKLKLTPQYILSLLSSIFIINIISFMKITSILNYDVLNYLNDIVFYSNFEIGKFNWNLSFYRISDLFKSTWTVRLPSEVMGDMLVFSNSFREVNRSILTTVPVVFEDIWNSNISKVQDYYHIDSIKFVNLVYAIKSCGISKERSVVAIDFFLDGLTFWLLWLVTIVSFVVSFNTDKKANQKNTIFGNYAVYNNFLNTILILMLICFSVKDLFIFFIAFEMILIPLFLHIIFQGSRFNKIQAVKYLVIYTMLGSVFLWYAISYFIEVVGTVSFDQIRWISLNYFNSGTKKILFLSLFLGFAFKVPMVPFHHWLIIAHVEAPTNGSIILAALLLKVGSYGIYRFVYNIFPLEVLQFSNEVMAIVLFGYTYATIMAIRQVDVKRYIAYTSIAHMNFSLLGLFSNFDIGILGYVHMMISHGIIATGMFFLIGYVYGILHFRDTIRLSGLAYLFPKFSFFFFIFSVANMGLPLFSGFPGEFFILISIINSNEIFALFIFFGFMFSGIYNFLQLNKILFSGNMFLTESKKNDDLDSISIAILSILIYWMVVLGLLPDIITQNVGISI